eukprot:jgi/Bigna1/132097/aug1.16_g6805
MSSIVSSWDGVQIAPDLLTVGRDAYIGNAPYIGFVTVHKERMEVSFDPIVVEEKVFVGPFSHLAAGTHIQRTGAVSAMAILKRNENVRSFTTRVGYRASVSYRPEGIYAPMTLYTFILVSLSSLHMCMELGAVGLLFAAVEYVLFNPEKLGLPKYGASNSVVRNHGEWIMMMTAVVLAVLSVLSLLISIVYIFIALAVKWLTMGRVDPERKYPLRGRYHAMWVFNLHLMYRVNGILGALKETGIVSYVYRWYGARVGRNVRFSGLGSLFPEADIYDIGDGAFIGCAAYGHNFLRGHLRFEPIEIGKGCRLVRSGTQVVPGVRLTENIDIGPGLNLILPGRYDSPGMKLIGIPGRPCVREQRRRKQRPGGGNRESEDFDNIKEIKRADTLSGEQKGTKESAIPRAWVRKDFLQSAANHEQGENFINTSFNPELYDDALLLGAASPEASSTTLYWRKKKKGQGFWNSIRFGIFSNNEEEVVDSGSYYALNDGGGAQNGKDTTIHIKPKKNDGQNIVNSGRSSKDYSSQQDIVDEVDFGEEDIESLYNVVTSGKGSINGSSDDNHGYLGSKSYSMKGRHASNFSVLHEDDNNDEMQGKEPKETKNNVGGLVSYFWRGESNNKNRNKAIKRKMKLDPDMTRGLLDSSTTDK